MKILQTIRFFNGEYLAISKASVLSSLLLVVSVIFANPAQAARDALILDADCVVSVLNRTIQANADGSFDLPNVPSFMGQIKARATCIRDGLTVTGETDYFTVQVNGVAETGQFYLANNAMTPSALTIANASPITLTRIDQTARLSVSADYINASSRDVTAAVSGTNYTSSNVQVATVSPNGVITAVTSGSVLITIRKDGAIAVAVVNVVTSGDADGDGIPDNIELDNGMDPNDSADAFEDYDVDGLTNLEDYTEGTGINKADWDEDGILDGEELIAGADGFITLPLNPDSDNDGYNDGFEVAFGSDPTTANDVNPADVLVGIDVVPARMEIMLNAIEFERTVQLSVVASVASGDSIDITVFPDTQYSSNNLSVCLVDGAGLVTFIGEGNCVVTVENGSMEARVLSSVEILPTGVFSRLELPATGMANNVSVQGSYAYIAGGADGLYVIDISNYQQPELLTTLALSGNANDIVVDSDANIAYIAGGSAGLHIIDIAIPSSPQLIDTVDSAGTAIDLARQDNFIYLADGIEGIQVIDLALPEPAVVNTLVSTGTAQGVDVSGDTLVVANVESSVDIITLDSGYFALSTENIVTIGSARNVLIVNGFASVATSLSLTTIDLSDTANISQFTQNPNDRLGMALSPDSEYLFTTENGFAASATIFDLLNPQQPGRVGLVVFADFSSWGWRGLGLDATDQYLFQTMSMSGFYDKAGVSGGSVFSIGQYRQKCDDPDYDRVCSGLEGAIGTEADNFDTDGDGLSDGYEILEDLDPLDVNDAVLVDTDGDGISDGDEALLYGTAPNNADTDYDAIPDNYEIDNGLDPLDPSDADIDTDGDGFSNRMEYIYGSNAYTADDKPEAGFQLWSASVGGGANSPAIAQDGSIYVGGEDGVLYALNPGGSEKWRYQTGDVISSAPAIGADGTIYIGSHDTYLYAVNPSGSLKWLYYVGAEVHDSPAIASNGNVLVTGGGMLHAVSPVGEIAWNWEVNDYGSEENVVVNEDTIYVSDPDQASITALDSNGVEIWHSDFLGTFSEEGLAIAADGTLYTVGIYREIASLYAIDSNGKSKWARALSNTPRGSSVRPTYTVGSWYTTAPVIGKDGVIYLSDCKFDVYAINPDSTIRWTKKVGDFYEDSRCVSTRPMSSLAVSKDGVVYSPALRYQMTQNGLDIHHNYIYGFYAETGEVVDEGAITDTGRAYFVSQWEGSSNAGSDNGGGIALSRDGTVYQTVDGTLYAVAGANGGLSDSPWPTQGRDYAGTRNSISVEADDDRDGLSSDSEIFEHNTNPELSDTDADGLSDGDEVNVFGTDPLDSDSDADGLSDTFEINNQLNPLDGEGDADGDELTDVDELNIHGTSPTDADSDGDGLWDGYEVDLNVGLDPLNSSDAAGTDTDGDGLKDLFELDRGLDPFDSQDAAIADTDGDGLFDIDELNTYGTDPTKRDSDFDLMPDAEEVNTVGRDPLDNSDQSADRGIWSYPTESYHVAHNNVKVGIQGDFYIVYGPQVVHALDVQGNFLWGFDARADVNHIVVSPGNGLVIATEDGLISLDVIGQEKWRYLAKTGLGGGAMAGIDEEPSIASDGTVYVTDYGELLAIDANGETKWVLDIAPGSSIPITTGSSIAADGTVYVLGNEMLYAVNPDGSVKWYTQADVHASIAIAGDGTLYGVGKEKLYAINADGSSKWTLDVPGNDKITSPTIGKDGTLYFGGGYVYNVTDRQALGLYAVSPEGELLDFYPTLVETSSPAVTADGSLIFNAYTNGLISLSSTFVPNWSVDVTVSPGDNTSPVILTDGTVCTVVHGGPALVCYRDLNGGIADAPWPLPRHDAMGTGNTTIVQLIDSDNDGLLDQFEIDYGFDAYGANESALDPDSDGLTNFEEQYFGASPLEADTDGDGLSDGDEAMIYGSSPINVDTDADEVSDWDEVLTYGTDPTLSDTDSDGLSDWYEVDNQLDPLDRTDAMEDADADGFSNLQEMLAESNPLDELSSPNTGTVAWSVEFDNSTSSPAIAADGTVYIVSSGISQSDNNGLYAFYPNGRLKWSYVIRGSLLSSPAVGVDGTIYTGSSYDGLYAINPNGTLKWTNSNVGEVSASPAIGSDGTVYVSSDNSRVYAISPNGFENWSYATGDEIVASPVIDAEGTVYVGSLNGVFYALNADGSLRWSYSTGRELRTAAAIGADGTVLIGSDRLYAFNPNGTIRWTSNVSGTQFVRSSPVIAEDGTIYIITDEGSTDATLRALNPDGTFKWSYDTTYSSLAASPAIGADGTVYFSTTSNFIALDADGGFKWSSTESGTSPVIAPDGTIYFGAYGREIMAIIDTSGGLANSPWPMVGHDSSRGGHSCRYPSGFYAGDLDNDSIEDCLEGNLGLDPSNADDAVEDADGDGLNALEELSLGTGIFVFDTDGDSLSDGDEVLVHGTDPSLADTDHDGISDGDEIDYGFDPLESEGTLDSDGDGFSNMQEGLTGFDLLDDTSFPAPGIEAWSYGLGGDIKSSPAIAADGTVYITSGDSNLYAFYPNGDLKWTYETGDSIYSSPAIAVDGTIYFGSTDRHIYAINPDGTFKWSYETGGDISSSPAIGINGTIYIGSQDDRLYAINPDGTFEWSYATGGNVESSPAVGADGTIYVGSWDDQLHAINADGTYQWSYLTAGNTDSSPAIGSDGTVYIGSDDDSLYAINSDGTLKWSYLTGGNVRSSPAIAVDGTIYVGSDDGEFYAINPDGTYSWSYDTGFTWDSTSSPAIGADGTVYVGLVYGDSLFALNPDSTLKWSYSTGDSVRSSPVIGADGTVYVGSSNMMIYAIIDDSGGPADSDWPMRGRDSSHSGRMQP